MSAAGTLDRLWDAFRKLVSAEVSQVRWNGTYEYTITATNGTTIDATPTDTELGLPGISSVQLRADSIATQTPTVGNTAHIVFLGGKLSRPVCVWTEPVGVSASLVGGGQPVARQGDFVSSAMPVGHTFTATIVNYGTPPPVPVPLNAGPVLLTIIPAVPPLPPTPPIQGTIITGRRAVRA